ncbi:MAG TPA: Holliday junction branch migration DNA helicase RuvB [Spirochaetota bacterium]|nr:Holliday junction branch migration DNA helicase RuvB [Spirochaetota bacterium]HOF13534.1 Holliday junction branch migration DNA helicase RuvB [Spirochaetota bacterium]HOM87008.1 Holliday junction branch migration DNA helicase RuvB [Spirochaetota bacterium]HOR93464.1 Holliday junction branch migration DNA helicase RuvB [Spirochaetota bacterium]HOT19116.1 Holliday junction branch migration DNA helicase RuvB [Spirochaetota bacterium]
MKKKEENNNPGIISPLSLDEEDFEKKLRPQRLSEFIGQKQLTENLRVFIESAKLRKKPLDHVLLAGPPGLGKTTLAFIVANELGVNIKATSAPAIEKSGDMASLLTNLEAMDVLFIDEIHRLSPAIEELLYSAMEDGELDIILGQGVGAKSIKLQLAPFTLIGATTRTGLLTSALRDRFGIPLRLDYYEIDDLETIALRTAAIIGCSIEEEAAQEIARRSRRTPRIVNRLVKRVLDFAIVHKKDMIDKQIALYALDKLHIDMLGLDDMDRKILSTIIDKYDGGPVGIKTIAISIGEEITTLEDFYEPYLVQIGMLKRTPRGRVAARLAYEHLGLAYKGIEDIQTLFE